MDECAVGLHRSAQCQGEVCFQTLAKLMRGCRSALALLVGTGDAAITLEGQLNITVVKQSLYGFWVSSNADQKRCQAAVAPNGRYRHSRYFREGVSPFQSMVTFAFELPLTRAQLQHEGISRQPRGSRMRFVKTSLSNHGLATIGR
jgi:hypothetical protein